MCVKNQLLEMLSPLVDIIGYIFLPDSFLFSGRILIHNALKQSLPLIILIVHITKNLSYMSRGSLQIPISLFKISTFCLPKSASASLVQVLDFVHHFSKRHLVEHHRKTYVHALSSALLVCTCGSVAQINVVVLLL